MKLFYKRILSTLFTVFLFQLISSQTLYWIGGSGDYNDPKHWSLSSGGRASFKTPDNQTNVVFDDFSSDGAYVVNFGSNNHARNFTASSFRHKVSFKGSSSQVVYITGGIQLSPLVEFKSSAELIFNSTGLIENTIEFGLSKLNCNVYFNEGKYDFHSLDISYNKTANFNKGFYKFHNTFLTAGNLISNDPTSSFDIKESYFSVSNNFKIDKNASVLTNKLYLAANYKSSSKFSAPANVTSLSTNTMVAFLMPICSLTISTTPSCSGPCTGVLTISFSPGCIDPPYNVIVNNPICPATAGTLSANNVTSVSSVYTATGACECATQNYQVLVFDASSNFVSQNVNFIANPVTITSNTVAPLCSNTCDGTMSGFIFGTPPFQVSMSPATVTPSSFTTNLNYNLTGLCAGVYTFNVLDGDGCSSTVTKTVSGPAPVSANPTTFSISCNAANNGSFVISPTGGTPDYTVQFSTGPTFTVVASGSASITNLPPGPYSATVTDSHGCTTVANTNITQPTALSAITSQTNLTCFTTCNGAASVAVSGGTTPYTYIWTPGPGNNAGITGLCAGTQTVDILDGNNCPLSKTFTITSPPAITLTLSKTDVVCNSLCNGSATVQASGGTAPLTFTWTGPAFGPNTNSVISGLCPGTYTLSGSDGNACTDQQTIAITEPPALTITISKTDNTCFSFCAGSATAVVSGGNGAPFSYTWSPNPGSGQGTDIAGGLCQGNYTLSVKDASACPISSVVNITQPTSITVGVTTTSVTCNAACDGVINANPSGGNGGPYTFTLVSPFATTTTANPPYTNLCAGVYTLSVNDASSCPVSQTINIAEPNPLVASIASSSITCFNMCNGSLAGSVLGGTPTYTLIWNTPTGTVSGGNLVNQCAGDYTFTVTDANGCTASQTVTLAEPADLTTTLNITNPTCNTSCNGVISTIVGGGTPGYTLNWSNSGGNPNTNLCAGVYTLLVTDSKGCNKSFTAGVTAPPAITLAINTSSTNCAGSCDGSATVTASGGTAPFTYQFNTIPVTINGTGIVGGLCSGNYIVSVSDNNGCPASQAFNIASPPLLTAAITGSVPTCNVCTGAATVTPAGGTPGYTVTWTDNVPAVVASGTAASNLCLGTYTANVVDSKGCTATASVNIVNTVSVTVVTGGNSILCFGACNASATANAIGGTAPYTYTWSTVPTQTTQSATGLCAGSYSVTVTDQLGCFNTGTINFTQPSSVTVNSTQTNVPCFGGCNGVITTTVSGGTAPYSYSWSPGGQTTTSVTSLCAGGYTLNLKDLNNCSQVLTYSITENPSLSATFTATNPSGCTVNNGTICATPSGGSGSGYTYTWSPPGSGGPNNSCNTDLGAGTYSLVITDGAGCTTTLSASLSNPAGPTVNVTSASITCFGALTGSAEAVASGTGPFTFTWSPATASVVNTPTSTATGMGAGNYNVNVTDGNGCVTSQTLNIAQPTSATVTSNVTAATCNLSCNGIVSTTISGGTPGYTYTWSPNPPVGQGTGTASSLCAGNYTININDANGCLTTKTFVINEPPSLTVTATQTNVTCNSALNGVISLTVSGGTPGYTFNWTPVGTFTGSTSNPVTGLGPNVYTVTVTDNNGCSKVSTYTITEPSALGQTVTSTNATCNSQCNGTASQIVTGGTPTYTFSWSSSASTSQTLGALCAGNYTASVVDANGCVASQSFVITEPSAISITATPTQPLCNGSCNGSVSTNVTGGNGGYSYNWVPAGAGPNPTGLCAGIYTLTVTDASLCINNTVITLTNPPAVIANVSFTNPLCNANCNGIVVSNPLNAASPVSYTWSTIPVTTASVASGLCAGTYTVMVEDANGCTDQQTVSLTNPPSLTVVPSIVPATCGSSNGSINVAPSGGTPAYTYTWFPAPASGTNSFVTNIPAGVYTVVVTDNNGCNNTVSIPVSNSNGPSSAAISATNVNCNSQATGAASVTNIVGGTPGYTISWVSPPAPSTVNPITNLSAGTYTAQIKDSNGCLLFQSVTITEPNAIDDNELITNAICMGVCNGSIELAPTGGTSPYTYQWSTAATTSVVTGLCVGTHTVTITDALNCQFTATYNVAGQINVLSTVATTSNICSGNCNGSATVTSSSGGTPPYNYSWSNSQSGVIANNLCNGNYSVTTTDANGCQGVFTASITSPAAIALSSVVASPSCGLCNGSSTVNANGGTSPYTYSWTTGGTAATESSLCAGLYQVFVTDNNGCSQVINIPISNSSGITGENFNVQDEQCFNDCNGSVTVSPIGGTAPITYNWITPVATGSVLTNLCGGTYFIQMTDAQGCVRTSSVSVNSATNINIATTVTAPSCSGSNGVITASVTGGSGIYTYTWLPAGNSATLNNVTAGSYTLFVNDGSCTKTTVVNVSNPTAPAIFGVKTDNGCSGMPCIGSVVLTPTLGTPAYSYNWSNGATTSSVSSLCGGVITVTVTDAAGCSAVQSYTIDENPALNLSLPIVTDILCSGDCNGGIAIVPSGGTVPYNITWVPSTTVTPANILTSLCSGGYTATVTDSKGCNISTTVNLTEPSPYDVTATINDATCNSSNDGAITTTITGGTPVYTYTWNGPATYTTPDISNAPSGTYTLSVIDTKGCQKDTVLTVNASFTVDAVAGKDTSFCSNSPITLDGSNSTNAINYLWVEEANTNTLATTVTTSLIPATGSNTYILFVTSSVAACFDSDTIVVNSYSVPYVDAGPTFSMSIYSSTLIGGSPTAPTALTFTWLPAGTLDDPTIPNPTASNTMNTTYTVFITDANGCTASDTMQVLIYPEIKIPNGFSPNSDGRNDYWVIDNLDQFPENEVEIYNRWGELLFRQKPYQNKFDGKYHGKDLPVGTYYYIIKLNHIAYPTPYTGPLTIFR